MLSHSWSCLGELRCNAMTQLKLLRTYHAYQHRVYTESVLRLKSPYSILTSTISVSLHLTSTESTVVMTVSNNVESRSPGAQNSPTATDDMVPRLSNSLAVKLWQLGRRGAPETQELPEFPSLFATVCYWSYCLLLSLSSIVKYYKPRMSPLLSQGTLDMLRDLEISRSLYIDVFSFFSRADAQGQGRDGLTGAGAWIRACWVQEWQIMMIYHHIMITLWCYIMLYDIILDCTIWSTIWYYYVLVQL